MRIDQIRNIVYQPEHKWHGYRATSSFCLLWTSLLYCSGDDRNRLFLLFLFFLFFPPSFPPLLCTKPNRGNVLSISSTSWFDLLGICLTPQAAWFRWLKDAMDNSRQDKIFREKWSQHLDPIDLMLPLIPAADLTPFPNPFSIWPSCRSLFWRVMLVLLKIPR